MEAIGNASTPFLYPVAQCAISCLFIKYLDQIVLASKDAKQKNRGYNFDRSQAFFASCLMKTAIVLPDLIISRRCFNDFFPFKLNIPLFAKPILHVFNKVTGVFPSYYKEIAFLVIALLESQYEKAEDFLTTKTSIMCLALSVATFAKTAIFSIMKMKSWKEAVGAFLLMSAITFISESFKEEDELLEDLLKINMIAVGLIFAINLMGTRVSFKIDAGVHISGAFLGLVSAVYAASILTSQATK